MGALSIMRSGIFTTVQDLGRWGFQSSGVSVSGAMDQYSHRLANRLVGNGENAATLEATLTGPQIAFEADIAFAVAGATFALTLNAAAIPMNQMMEAKAGSVLTFGERLRGARSYIAVSGGVDVPEVLGSRSTHVLTGLGGFEGRALRVGDRIRTLTGVRGKGREANNPYPFPLTPLNIPPGGARVRVIPGEQSLFAVLASQRFRISPRSDRMGYRLDVAARSNVTAGELISRAVATGVVQIPPTGQPILLMADHATTGGYAIGATVITADLPLAGQLAPGDWIEFEACSLEAADQALQEQEATLGRP
jgi:antagonist of KipI